MVLLELRDITKRVGQELILKRVSLRVETGEFIAIIGPSGSGKSSLLYIMGLLDRPTSGTILYRNEIIEWKDAVINRLRNQKLGFVFQFHYLIPELNVLENVMAPQLKAGRSYGEAKERALELLTRLGLDAKSKRQVFEISGGEMQRVAIARALANNPEILLCDEPTGNLDTKNTQRVMEIFEELNQEGTTIVMVTHDMSLAERAKRVIEMRDGEIVADR